MMKTRNTLRTLAVVTGLAISSGLLAAGIDHSDRPSCYLSVHSQCYVDSDSPCSDDDYQWGLDQCDTSYPAQRAVPPAKPLGLKASTKQRDMRFRSQVRMSFRN